ncbi:hypothetical protein QE152_g41425, partial [Popillia japonica]
MSHHPLSCRGRGGRSPPPSLPKDQRSPRDLYKTGAEMADAAATRYDGAVGGIPQFDIFRTSRTPNYTVVQAQTRTTAVLHCEVASIGNNTVTWKRRRDYKILTFGILTYSSDSRFFARPEKNGK